jgi:hypothetical protein
MPYQPIHKRTGREYTPVTEERMNELKSHPATADSFRFVAIEERFVSQPKIESGETSAKKSKKIQADNNEQNIDSGAGSEPLQQN